MSIQNEIFENKFYQNAANFLQFFHKKDLGKTATILRS